MSAPTRTQAVAACALIWQEAQQLLDHVLEAIMGYQANSEVKQALTFAGVESLQDLLTLDGESFSQITYMAGTDEKRLRILDVVKLKKVSPFHVALCDHKAVFILLEDQWLQTTDTDWERVLHQRRIIWERTDSAYYIDYCNRYYDSTNHPPRNICQVY